MRVLELCMSKGFGGLELYVVKVISYLSNENHEFEVLSRKNSFLSKKIISQNLVPDTFSFVFHLIPLISAIRLAIYIKKNKIDIVHVHWGKDLFFAVLAKAFCRGKVKIVYTRQMSLTRPKDDIYHRFLYRNVDSYLVITRALYNDALKYLPIRKENVDLLYYGVPASDGSKKICNEYLEKSELDASLFRLAIFGRIEKGKGQHLVIDAIKTLKTKGVEVQLGIIGHIMDQSYFSSLQDTISNNQLETNIKYLGFHESPTSIMPCFDTVVLATKCETFGLVLPEAMRAGVAVIGSNCGGVPEIIEHEITGLLFETQNSNDLAEQIEKLTTNKIFCDQIALAGKEEADERFSEEKHFEKLISIFESA